MTRTVLDPASPGACVVGLDLSLTGTGVAAIDMATAALSTAVHSSPPPAVGNLAGHAARHRHLADGIVAQVVAADPALAVIEGLQFSVKMRDSSLTRRGFLWWAVIEGLCDAGVPVMEVTPQQIKQFATGRGNASKAEMVAAYAKAWPDADLGRNVEDRADAAHAAALGAAWIGVGGLPQTETAVRKKLLAKLPEPTLPISIPHKWYVCTEMPLGVCRGWWPSSCWEVAPADSHAGTAPHGQGLLRVLRLWGWSSQHVACQQVRMGARNDSADQHVRERVGNVRGPRSSARATRDEARRFRLGAAQA